MTVKLTMVREFQCSGCVRGSSPTTCDRVAIKDAPWGPHTMFACEAHAVGTTILGIGQIYLGMPKGFNRVGDASSEDTRVRLWAQGNQPSWNHLNVAVWAMEHDGYLFVRTYAPRTNTTYVDIVEKGTLGMVPNAINVAEFYDEID